MSTTAIRKNPHPIGNNPLTYFSHSFEFTDSGRSSIQYIGNHFVDQLNILKGQRVLEYGIGLGRNLSRASRMVGDNGFVIATDTNPGAMLVANFRIQAGNLYNILPLQIKPYKIDLPDKCLHLIYSLKGLQSLTFPDLWLQELHRLLMPEGTLVLGLGNLELREAKKKIYETGIWEIVAMDHRLIRCRPI